MMSVITSSYSNVASSFFSQKFQKYWRIIDCSCPNACDHLGLCDWRLGRSILVGTLVLRAAECLFVGRCCCDIIDDRHFIFTRGIIKWRLCSKLWWCLNRSDFCLATINLFRWRFYAISMLPPFWQAVSKINPIVYMISGFRYGFRIADVSIISSMTILIGFIVVLYTICWQLIERGRGLRS